ncbi:hypothetical protein EYC84_003243 [Monilinia fructicola]|uniref:Uncharacterized protein n=1 Tax=Monilinia fructicola TaxID=38448 RepID=A0A5M9JXM1_MONFR|nr:hypothetical protein EYC84_003243 [Monilinia fructicola]
MTDHEHEKDLLPHTLCHMARRKPGISKPPSQFEFEFVVVSVEAASVLTTTTNFWIGQFIRTHARIKVMAINSIGQLG